MSLLDDIEDFFDEDAKYERAYADGESVAWAEIEEEELKAAFEHGYDSAYYEYFDEVGD